MTVLKPLADPWVWVALYAAGITLVLTFLGHRRLRRWVYEKTPRWVVMAVALITIILPPIALPFVTGPVIGLPPLLALPLGGLLFAANVAAKIASQRRIGKLPALRKKSTLVTGGIYSVVRHPLYMSNCLMALGLALLLNSLYALIFFFPYCLGFTAIIHFEEEELQTQYGKAYQNYRRQVPWRLVPWVY